MRNQRTTIYWVFLLIFTVEVGALAKGEPDRAELDRGIPIGSFSQFYEDKSRKLTIETIESWKLRRNLMNSL